MNMLITKKEFNQLKSREPVPLKCKECETIFHQKKHALQAVLKGGHTTYDFCSKKCAGLSKRDRVEIACKQCDKKFIIFPCLIRDNGNFCCRSCAGIYNNAHKTKGYTRSKLEIWLEQELPKLYPKLNFKFNDRETIGLELDIYIPELNLAFELNGPLHYQVIYGKEKLAEIQSRDRRKEAACPEKDITLVTIDVSTLKYFKPEKAQRFLNMIVQEIGSQSR